MRNLGTVALCVALGGCALQRAEIAQDARAQMVGLTKEQVLACMGAARQAPSFLHLSRGSPVPRPWCVDHLGAHSAARHVIKVEIFG